jgi:hypothetical protein
VSRVTDKERKRLHAILDECIDIKLNSEKNSKKSHWNKLLIPVLSKMQLVEANELELAMFTFDIPSVISECYDNIAIPLFIIDNIKEGQG